MALSNPTLLDTAVAPSSHGSLTSGTISPTANALLVVCVGQMHSTILTDIDSCADTFSGTGAWTEIVTKDQAGTGEMTVSIWIAQAGATPGSGTITVGYASDVLRGVAHFLEVTGHDTTTPVPETGSNAGTASTLAITLSASPAADSMSLGMIISRADDGITEGSGFTEIANVSSGGTPNIYGQAQYNNSSPDSVVDWSGVAIVNNVGVAIEIAAAAAEEPEYARGKTFSPFYKVRGLFK